MSDNTTNNTNKVQSPLEAGMQLHRDLELAYAILDEKIHLLHQRKGSISKITSKYYPVIITLKRWYNTTKNKVKTWIYGEPPSPLKIRMQKLAGITPKAAARLYVADKEVDLINLPSAWRILKFRMCGFRYEILHPFDE